MHSETKRIQKQNVQKQKVTFKAASEKNKKPVPK